MADPKVMQPSEHKAARKGRAVLTIQETLDLLATDQPISAAAVYSLSDLNDQDFAVWSARWPTLPADRRIQLIQHLGDISETNFEMDFARALRLAFNDPEPEVRAAGVDAAWYDETPAMLRRLIALTESDPSDLVRAQAVSSIGRFILLGELDKLNSAATERAQNAALMAYHNDESSEVNRRAIEALGNSSRDDLADLIQEAYESDNAQMRASAVFAMGRSCDEGWSSVVIDELTNADSEMRYEAARAAGELELRGAIPVLGQLLDDPDREVLEVAVWALGEIGGDLARHLLENAMERADQTNDDYLSEAIDEALASASLVGGALFDEDEEF